MLSLIALYLNTSHFPSSELQYLSPEMTHVSFSSPFLRWAPFPREGKHRSRGFGELWQADGCFNLLRSSQPRTELAHRGRDRIENERSDGIENQRDGSLIKIIGANYDGQRTTIATPRRAAPTAGTAPAPADRAFAVTSLKSTAHSGNEFCLPSLAHRVFVLDSFK